MIRALRRRAASGEDGGFVLIYVLFVTAFVMIGTASMLSLTANNVRPAIQGRDTAAAIVAAQSGIQDFLANLNAHCRTLSIQSCDWLGDAPVVAATTGDQSYSARAVNPDNYLSSNNGTVRIVSTGRSGTASRTLTADASGLPSVLRFAYFSNFETLGKAFLDSYYPARTIRLTDATLAGLVGLSLGSAIHWNGAGGTPQNGYTDDVCDRTYYGAQGRSVVAGVRTALGRGTDFSEDGTLSGGEAISRDVACEVNFSSGMAFDGPVYSRDALRITYGSFGTTSGPTFSVPRGETLPALSTGWDAATTPAAPATAPYRSDPVVGGVPTVTAGATAQPVQSLPVQLSLPATASPRPTCTYTGPTRIVLKGGTAYVASPLSSGSGACFRTGSSGAYEVAVGRTTIQVRDAATSTSGPPAFPAIAGVAAGLTLGANNDITTYSRNGGDAYVQGQLSSGRLSLVTDGDVVVTGDVTTSGTTGTNVAGERAWASGGAIALIATKNVRVYHPVACAVGSATDGYCPNDASGRLENSDLVNSDGTLTGRHPSKQYTDLRTPASVEVDAAVMALSGSLYTDNFNRGSALGTLTVKGGVYQNHRGALGQLWEAPAKAVAGTRPSSGYKLAISYLSYTSAGLPYVPVLDTDGTANPLKPWHVLSVATGGTP